MCDYQIKHSELFILNFILLIHLHYVTKEKKTFSSRFVISEEKWLSIVFFLIFFSLSENSLQSMSQCDVCTYILS